MTHVNRNNREDFFIREKEDVLEGLNLDKQSLEQIIEQIDRQTEKFIWEEGIHFRYHVKKDKIRFFSRLGLIVIGEYFEKYQQLDQAKKVFVLLEKLDEGKKEREIDKEIFQRTSKNCSSLNLKRNRYWIDLKDLRRILKTSNERLRKAFKDIQRSDLPLILEEDFEDREEMRYYSFSGLARICLELSEQLSNKDRRLYIKRVPKVAIPVLEKIKFLPEVPSDKNVKNAMNQASRIQGYKCQITGESEKEITLAVHHLYDQSTYPYLAADQDNLLVIQESIHKEFHNWNEGFIKPCTIDDFISFIENHPEYSKNFELLIKLDERKTILENKLKSGLKLLPESSNIEILGRAKVLKIFPGYIAGCFVESGKMVCNRLIRVYRDQHLIFEGNIDSLKIFAKYKKEVSAGYKCGLRSAKFNDWQENDIIECYIFVE